MGILNSLFGGNGQPTATTQHLAQQLGNAVWMTTSYNPHMQQINATALHNPSTWEMVVPLEEQIKELRYILQRTVENYDELQAQYKALQDIAKAEENK
jgi:hypothetical protein